MSADAPSHVFLGAGHREAERRTTIVVGVCLLAMAVEIAGGTLFGSVALVADGLHMSTHAGALLLAALAYRIARRRAHDPRFSFGTGKLGDLAGFASAVALGLIAVAIGAEAVHDLFAPAPIRFGEAIPIAVFGLLVNVGSAAILGVGDTGDRGHGHAHGHPHGHGHGHGHAQVGRDNNMRAAAVHVLADAAVSLLVIVSLVSARLFGLPWLDPAAALVGAVAVGWWSCTLVRATGAVLLDMRADAGLERAIRDRADAVGDRITDLHVWRLGPGHLGAIVSLRTRGRDAREWRAMLGDLEGVSHLTVEALPDGAPERA